MRKVFTVFKREVGKLFSSWRRTFTLFLLPAVFLVGMLNLFPILLNYLSTGTLNKMPVTVVNAPDSFMEFIDDTLKAKSFRYNYMTDDERNFSTRFARFINEKNVMNITDELTLAQQHIEQNVNARMVFFDFALKMIVLLIQK